MANSLRSDAPQVTVLAMGYQFCEAPRVDGDGTIWFSDLHGGGYHRIRAGEPARAYLPMRQWVGGAVFCEDGALILSGRGGLVRLDRESGAAMKVPLATGDPFELCVNDLEATPDGALIGGTIDFASIMGGGTPALGKLFHLAVDGTLTILRDDVFASNGLGFSPCGRWLYHSETRKGVWRYPLGADGLPGAGTLLVAMEDSDGLVVDSEGGIWVAGWASAGLYHLRADGTQDRVVHLPFPHVVSLAFGGPDLHDLYITTGGDDERPELGGVVKIRVDVPGTRDFKARIASCANRYLPDA